MAVPLELRIYGYQIIRAIQFETMTGVKYDCPIRTLDKIAEIVQTLGHRGKTCVNKLYHFRETGAAQGCGYRKRVVLRIRQGANMSIIRVADHQRHPSPGWRCGRNLGLRQTCEPLTSDFLILSNLSGIRRQPQYRAVIGHGTITIATRAICVAARQVNMVD